MAALKGIAAVQQPQPGCSLGQNADNRQCYRIRAHVHTTTAELLVLHSDHRLYRRSHPGSSASSYFCLKLLCLHCCRWTPWKMSSLWGFSMGNPNGQSQTSFAESSHSNLRTETYTHYKACLIKWPGSAVLPVVFSFSTDARDAPPRSSSQRQPCVVL